MDFNLYGLEHIASSRLADARAEGAHARLLASLRASRAGVRSAVGLALIRLGRVMTRRPAARRRGRWPVPSWS
jgi:hypothetical protein